MRHSSAGGRLPLSSRKQCLRLGPAQTAWFSKAAGIRLNRIQTILRRKANATTQVSSSNPGRTVGDGRARGHAGSVSRQAPADGWRTFEIVTKVEVKGLADPRVWVPLPFTAKTDWHNPLGNKWTGNGVR